MATTERYIALSPDKFTVGNVTETSAGTATAQIELRMMVIKSDGTTHTNLTIMSVIKALEVLKNYLVRGGVGAFNNTGTKALPQPAPGPVQQ